MEDSQYQQVGLTQVLRRSLLFFPLGPDMHESLCAHSKSGVSVSASPVEFPQSKPTSLQILQVVWGLLLLLPDLKAGDAGHGAQNFHFCGNTSVMYFTVCGSLTLWVWDLVL